MDFILENAINGNFIFYLFGLIAISGGLYMLFTDNLLYAAYGLLVSFLGVAGVFVFGGAEFVAAAQIMIYIGGILILLIFGIMLSNDNNSKVQKLKVVNKDRFLTIVIVSCLSLIFIFLSASMLFDQTTTKPDQHIKNLGYYLMTDTILILELLGLLLLVALIGATFIAKNDE